MKLSPIFLCLFAGITVASDDHLAGNHLTKNQPTLGNISYHLKQDLSHLVWKSIIESDESVDKISSECRRDVKSHFTDKSVNFCEFFFYSYYANGGTDLESF